MSNKERRYSDDEQEQEKEKEQEQEQNPGNVLYVHGFSSQVQESDVKDLFSKEGKVEKVTLVIDPETGRNRGFGFVQMATTQEADDCIKNLSQTEFFGAPLSIEKSKRGSGRTKTPGRYMGTTRRRDYDRRYDDRYDRRSDRYDRRNDRNDRYDRYDRNDRYDRGGDRYDRKDDRDRYDRGGDRYDRKDDRDRYDRGGDRYDRKYDKDYDKGYQKRQ